MSYSDNDLIIEQSGSGWDITRRGVKVGSAATVREAVEKAQHLGHVALDGQPAHCVYCFAGETRYLTSSGVKTFDETVGTTQLVLSSDPNDRTNGRWVHAHIQEFGVQPLLKVTLKRNQQRKVVFATAEHRWLVKQNLRKAVTERGRNTTLGHPRGFKGDVCSRGHVWTEESTLLREGGRRECRACARMTVPVGGISRSTDMVVVTSDLHPGHRLSFLRSAGAGSLTPSDEGIRHGIVFGDGTAAGKRSTVNLWGEKDKQLLPYFSEETHRDVATPNGVLGVRVSLGRLKASMKALPDDDATSEYFYGWMAGYFAADGCVSKSGQVTLASANLSNLEAVRDIATKLGIATYGITSLWRKGFPDREPSLLHKIQFISSTLNEAFFLTESHRDRYSFSNYTYERIGWTVESVVETDRVETVYCAVVPETGTFALDDNIWVGNCGSGAITGRSDGMIECSICRRTFVALEQPLYSTQPSAEFASQTIPGQPDDPNALDAPAAPAPETVTPVPTQATDTGVDMTGIPPFIPAVVVDPDDDPFVKASSKYVTDAGAVLTKTSYIKHLTYKYRGNR